MKTIIRVFSLLLCLCFFVSGVAAESVQANIVPCVVSDSAQPTVIPSQAEEPAPAASESKYPPEFKTEAAWIHVIGDLYLGIRATDLLESGYEYGDLLSVTISGQTYQMPLVSIHSDVDDGTMICVAEYDEEAGKNYAYLAINLGDLTTTLGIAKKITIQQDPGYRWEYIVETPVTVTIAMQEKGGYAAEYYHHHLIRSNDRNAYPQLTDEEFANFRNVSTTGMGARMLYRSSNPVNPELKRNREADKALGKAGIRTVMNLADTEKGMRRYKGFWNTYYSKRKVIALNLATDLRSDEFKAGLAKGMEFFAANQGPYLVHCREGKDRAGFVCAVLESLMGASADEIVADYMVTFYNYYGVEPGSDQYYAIAHANIEKTLATVFEITDIHEADLAECAEKYLHAIGLSDKTIAALKKNLGTSR